jgi:two-component system response regulator HydG
VVPDLFSEAPAQVRVLVIEDDDGSRRLVTHLLGQDGYQVVAVATGEEGLKALGTELYDLVLLDLGLPGLGGMDLLGLAPGLQTDAQFVVMTGQSSVDTAVEAMKLGAFDYVSKPFSGPELLLKMRRALEERERRREVTQLRLRAGAVAGPTMIGHSPVMRRLRNLIARVAPTNATVLITGETGTGKEVVAQMIHALSARAHKAFVAVNCTALPESLLESELFGHLKGSFTGAIATKRGLFEEAAEGTLLLDEVGVISPAIQVKLLRALQERKIQRVGGGPLIPVNFRLIAATNVDLAGEVAAGRFRDDLYYRLNVFPIGVPPLRERGEDVLLLANHFRKRFADENDIVAPMISPALARRLPEYEWPGNVRQLESFIQRAIIMHAGAIALPADLPDSATRQLPQLSLSQAEREEWPLHRLEQEYILQVLQRTHGQLARAAIALGIDRRTLHRKLTRYKQEGLLTELPPQDS